MYEKDGFITISHSTKVLTAFAGPLPHDSEAKRRRRTGDIVACEEGRHGQFEAASRGFESKNVKVTMEQDALLVAFEAKASVSYAELAQQKYEFCWMQGRLADLPVSLFIPLPALFLLTFTYKNF
jgi:HSP20 family molecular chaperone IbpA